ncbi:MAG: glycosyltransferase family 2 protein, partial [Acidimicrobiia bacterium]|nr:glycosyltransferase family 2 protein [Acidimicrobiia bacterium]
MSAAAGLGRGPRLSVVVVVHDMGRELPRTLRTLATPYQRDIDPVDYEIIVVDNGSSPAAVPSLPAGATATIRVHRIDQASASPAGAANEGIAAAHGEIVGLIIDGARMASPGLLHGALLAATLAPRPVVTAPAWHLGPTLQAHAATTGYDQIEEDALLARSGWEHDGYALFTIASPAASSARGLFGPMGESSSLFLHRDT